MSFIDFIKKLIGCKETEWRELYFQVDKHNTVLINTIAELEDQNKPWDEGEKPDWLNDTIKPYEPIVEIEGEIIKLEPNDIYMESPSLRKVAAGWRDLTLDEKLWEIWKYVIVKVNYKHDIRENWIPGAITVARGWGDCDDSTILFITLARIAHVPSDRVFNATGWYDDGTTKYGHSFPIVKLSDDKWYVMESTLQTIPGSPKLFKGSNYDCSWGVSNSVYFGKLFKGNQL